MSAVLEKATERLMTADEFFYSPYSKGFELVEGRVVPKGGRTALDMPAGGLHGLITNRLSKLLTNYVDDKGLGEVFAAETGFTFNNNTVRGLDVSFIASERLAQYDVPETYITIAPDLAVEVASPGNSPDELMAKVQLYLQSGTRLVWVVYPKTKIVQVYRVTNVVSLLHENDVLEGEDVVPGFQMQVARLFKSNSGNKTETEQQS